MKRLSVAAGILVVGVDEAGRGAIAGPVVAGACILRARKKYPVRIGDSKKLSPAEREESYEWLTQNCVTGFGMVSATEIDRIGILAATEIAMQEAVRMVAEIEPNLYVLVDGRDAFWFDYPHSSLVRGDESEPMIGAASIIAKVTRDRYMVSLDAEFPEYGFAQHKGYGTPEHYAAIKKYGAHDLHRRTFSIDATLSVVQAP